MALEIWMVAAKFVSADVLLLLAALVAAHMAANGRS
jgi:hypothetical protein